MNDEVTVHRGYAWPPVTPHDPAAIAALWHDIARMRMNARDFEGAHRAIRAEVNLTWQPGRRSIK